MKQRWKLPVCLLLSFVLLLSATGMVFAAEGAAPAGVYELTTDRGGSRAPVWETATLTVDDQGAMALELLLKDSMTNVRCGEVTATAGEAVEKDGVRYIPYTVPLAGKTETVALTVYVAAMKSDVTLNVGLSGWEAVIGDVPAGETPAEEAPVAAGEHAITVANASTSAYGATTVYPDAALLVNADGSCVITIYLKNSLANIRTEDGTPVSAGEAKTLTMNGEEGTYYPYAFPIAMRQATLKVLDDVPAMSHVASMNNGKDMTTTINVDWTSAKDLEIAKLENGSYEIPVAFQTASSMLTLEPTAALQVADGDYALTVSFPADSVSDLSYNDISAEKSGHGDLDHFTLHLTEELGQIPVKLTVTRMQGTAMAVQSFVIVPDWTKAAKAAAEGAYDGETVSFVKADGSAFGMFTAQEGTTAVLEGENVRIHYVPKNTTVYNALHWGAIDEELTKDVLFNEDGSFDLTVSADKCGTLIAVALIKVKDGGTTKDQYYLAIPAAEKLEQTEGKLKVVPSSQKLKVNGEEKATEVYNVNGSNYFKLRDIAALLTGTGSQFNVEYNEAARTVIVTTGAAYTPQEGDLTTGTDKSASIVRSSQTIQIDGAAVSLAAYNFGGNNFFKLRDLGEKLGFGVDYDEAARTMLVTSK